MSSAASSASPARAGATPVTMLISRRAEPGREQEFVEAMAAVTAAASRYPGYLGGHLVHPALPGDRLFHIIFAFDSPDHIEAWQRSEERRAVLQRLEGTVACESPPRPLTGLEGWFTTPGAPLRLPPTRPRMALVTWIGIFPLVLLFQRLIGPWLGPISPLLATAVATALVTIVMTWGLMPQLTKRFSRFLFPKSKR